MEEANDVEYSKFRYLFCICHIFKLIVEIFRAWNLMQIFF